MQPIDYTLKGPSVADQGFAGIRFAEQSYANEQAAQMNKQDMDIKKQTAEFNKVANERETEMFNDKDRYMNIYSDLVQVEALPESQREAFIQARIEKGTAEGKDMSDSLAYLQASPEERKQISQGIRRIGQERGFIDAVADAPKEGLVSVYDKESGANVFVKESELSANAGRFAPERAFANTTEGMTYAEQQAEKARARQQADIEAGVIKKPMTVAQTELEKGRGKAAAEKEAKIGELAQSAQSALVDLDRAKTLLDKGVSTGLETLGGFTKYFNDNEQQFDALADAIALGNKDLLGGGVMTDADFNILRNTSISLTKSEESNKAAIDAAIAAKKRALQEARDQQAYINANGNLFGYTSAYLDSSKAEQRTGTKEAIKTSNVVERIAPDGRIALFDADTKRFMGYKD